MATDRLVKVTNDKGEETIERVPEGTVDDLRKVGADVEDPKTGQKNVGRPVYEAMSPEDGLNIAKEVAKCLRDALREHGDEIKAMALGSVKNTGTIVRVMYKPDEQGNAEEDNFVFHWDGDKLILGSYNDPVEICDLQKQSGSITFQKDLAKNALLNFIKNHDGVDSSQVDSQPVDPNAMPDGPVAEENLWESEEAQNNFIEAVKMYRCAKDKESIKSLFKACRPFQKGNTIQEKLKGAVDWYNIYKENPPKNTKDQVFLEDENNSNIVEAFQKISEGLNTLKEYVNQSEDLHFGSYYRDLRESFDRMLAFAKEDLKYDREALNEFYDLDDPIAQGYERDYDDIETNYGFEDEDEPAIKEGDEFGPEVGDEVDYDGGHYKLYGYCGYEVVLQNVDDERDFKIVKPADVGIGQKQEMKEMEYIDPEQLPDDESNREERI